MSVDKKRNRSKAFQLLNIENVSLSLFIHPYYPTFSPIKIFCGRCVPSKMMLSLAFMALVLSALVEAETQPLHHNQIEIQVGQFVTE
jgi:hypothetical protein